MGGAARVVTPPKGSTPIRSTGKGGGAIIGYKVGNATYNNAGQPTNNAAKAAAKGTGGGGGKGGPLAFVDNAFKAVGDTVSNAVNNVNKTVDAIIKNPLPLIETAGLISVGVPPSVASASVTAMNGGSVKDIVNAGIVAYGAEYVAGKVSANLPTDISATTVKIVSSAAGADAATTIKSLANGKNIGDALNDGLNAGAGAGAGTAAGLSVDNKILSGAASGAASGATTAALTGKDIGSAALTGAEQGAIKPATDVALGVAKDALGNIPKPDLTGASDILNTIRKNVSPYVDPVLNAAKDILHPVNEAISAAAKPVGEAISSVTKPVGEAITSAGQSIKDATKPATDILAKAEIPLTQAINEAPNLYHDNQVIAQMGKTPDVPGTSASTTVAGSDVSKTPIKGVSDTLKATTSSPTAYGAGDVAMLDATTPEGMNSKMGKKGGKYPWGDPEGTTALKQEGQVV